MLTVLLALLKFPDGGLLSVGIPLMLAVSLPTEEARFMLPLIRRMTENEARFLPNATAGQIKTGIGEGFTEVQPFGVGMENIYGRIVCHDLFHIVKASSRK